MTVAIFTQIVTNVDNAGNSKIFAELTLLRTTMLLTLTSPFTIITLPVPLT